MRALVVYESMYGATHELAQAVAEGLRVGCDDVDVVAVSAAGEDLVDGADLLVVGGPTHMHGMVSDRSRRMAVERAEKDDDVELDPDAEGPGLRAWFDAMGRARGKAHGPAAAFDTRLEGSPLMTGRASKAIAHRLHRHGNRLVVDPESFLVDHDGHLLPGELERGTAWGATVAAGAAARVGS